MSGREIGYVVGTITGVTATGSVTMASTAGFYKGAVVWLNLAGQPSKRAVIQKMTSTVLWILFRDNEPGTSVGYGYSDPTLYNTGTVTQHEQFIYDKSDGAF